jgi:hypothetical protein
MIFVTSLRLVTPERLNRGSSPKCPGFPLRACGNDGLEKRHPQYTSAIFEAFIGFIGGKHEATGAA